MGNLSRYVLNQRQSRSVLLQALAPSRGNYLGIVNYSIDVLAEIVLEQPGKPNKPREKSGSPQGVLTFLF